MIKRETNKKMLSTKQQKKVPLFFILVAVCFELSQFSIHQIDTGPVVRKRKIPMELQRLFARLQMADVYATSTADLTDSFGWQGGQMFVQHDVHELNRYHLYSSIIDFFLLAR